MQQLRENERELIKLINYFRKTAERLIQNGKLGEEHGQMSQACENLVSKLHAHAEVREGILQKRETIKGVIKDNAKCPKCEKNSHLKMIGTDRNEKGWKMNKYKCRRCNIEFVWNRPNNPWDMLPYMEELIKEIEKNTKDMNSTQEAREEQEFLLSQVQESYFKLKPVIESSDFEFHDLEEKQLEMDKMIKDFKSYLLIEKVKMEAIEQ